MHRSEIRLNRRRTSGIMARTGYPNVRSTIAWVLKPLCKVFCEEGDQCRDARGEHSDEHIDHHDAQRARRLRQGCRRDDATAFIVCGRPARELVEIAECLFEEFAFRIGGRLQRPQLDVSRAVQATG